MDDEKEENSVIPLITDFEKLLQNGIVARVPIETGKLLDAQAWKHFCAEYSQVTPLIASEVDGEDLFYRNILEEPDFPFDILLQGEIGKAIQRYFDADFDGSCSILELDDAFCVHYNESQGNTIGKKHMDPCDITVNVCLEKSDDCQGSHVLFHGRQPLLGLHTEEQPEDNDDKFQFMVRQEPGYATVHWGKHPHETTKLVRGRRTNFIFTFCYTNPTKKQELLNRSCYNV